MTDTSEPRGLRGESLGFRFARRAPWVLQGVSVGVAPGELVAVIGANGAGKSCLLRVLAGLVAGDGRLLLDGRPLAELAPARRSRHVAYVSQDQEVRFPFAVLESVLLGRPERTFYDRPGDLEAARAALERVSAGHLAERRLDTLSGGERRRVVLARALAQETDYLVLDEPTEALDPAHRLAFFQVLRECADSGKGVLVASHHLDLCLRFPDRVLVLAAGRAVACGPPGEVLDAPVLRQAFGVESRILRGPADFPVPTLALRLPPPDTRKGPADGAS